MATKPMHTPLDQSLLAMGQPKGEARPASVLDSHPASKLSADIFEMKPAVEQRSGLTIRIKVGAARRLNYLSRRTGRTKQELLDTAIARLLDDADEVGGLTAPL